MCQKLEGKEFVQKNQPVFGIWAKTKNEGKLKYGDVVVIMI